MYSQQDFFKIFQYLNEHPNKTSLYQVQNDNLNSDEMERNTILQRQIDVINNSIEMVQSYLNILNQQLYTLERLKYFVEQSSEILYNRIKDLYDIPSIANEMTLYIAELEASKPIITWTSPPVYIVQDNTMADYVSDIDISIINLAITTRNEVTGFFKNVMDQPAFNTDDYNKLRRMIIDWYSTFRTLLKLQKQTTNPFLMTKELLDTANKSFGFSKIYAINEKDLKAGLLLSLVDIYKKKGSPDSIVEILKFLGLDDISIYEWWLYRQRGTVDGDLYLQGQRVTKSENANLESMLRTNRYLSYAEFEKMAGPHWYYREAQIKAVDDTLTNLSLPSIMPYFSIAYYLHFSSVLQSAMFLNRLCNDLFVKYIQQNTEYINNDRIIYVEELNQKMSVFELYLCLNYAYNRYNDYVKFTELNNFLSTEYGIISDSYSTAPFIGVYPFRYEKLVNWTKFQTTSHGLNLFVSLMFGDSEHHHPSFKFYPKDVEIFYDLEYIGQGELLNIDYDNITGPYSIPSNWLPNHSYSIGDLVKPTSEDHATCYFKCTVTGTSNSTEPSWIHSHIDDVTTDNTVSWKYVLNGTIHDIDYYPYIIPTQGSYYLDQCHFCGPTYALSYWTRNENIALITVFFENHGYVKGQEIIISDSTDLDTLPSGRYIVLAVVDDTSFTVNCIDVGNISGECTIQNVFDQYNTDTYESIIKQEWDVLFKRFKILTDIYTIKKSKAHLPLDGVNYKIGDLALIIKDETDFIADVRFNWVDRTQYNPRIYKCIATTGTIDEQWELQVDNDIYEEWHRLYQKLLHNKYMQMWTWKFAKNYARNRKDPERILNGTAMPVSVEDYYNLPTIGNTLDSLKLVNNDSTRGYLPVVYKCIAITGTIDEQWEYDENGLWKLNYAVNNTLVPLMIEYTNGNDEVYFNLAETLVTYLNVFIHTYIQTTAPNFRELLLGSFEKIKLLIGDIKPKRARLLSYETIYGLDDKLQDSLNGQDILNGKFFQKAEWDRRENIRDSDQRNYDTVNPYHYTSLVEPNKFDVGDVYDGDFIITIHTDLQFITINNGTPHFIASVVKSGTNVSWDMGNGTIISNVNNIDYAGYTSTVQKAVMFSVIDDYTYITELNASNDQLTEMRHLELLTNLTHLDLSSNQLTGPYSEIARLSDLTYLNLSNNTITYIGIISGLTDLIYLNLEDNDLVQLGNVANMINLVTLNLNNNALTDIGLVTNLTQLQSLELLNNGFLNIGIVTSLTNLQRLYLKNNELTNIGQIDNLTDLLFLDISYNNLTDVGSLINLTNLTNCYLENNEFNESTLSNFVDQLWSNEVYLKANSCDIKLEGNCGLSSATAVEKIEGLGAYSATPIKGGGCTISYDFSTNVFSFITLSTIPDVFSPLTVHTSNVLWNLGDGTLEPNDYVSHTYATSGEKTVKLLCDDFDTLTELHLSNNKIKSLSEFYLNELQVLDLSDNNSSLHEYFIDVKYYPKLTNLNISNNTKIKQIYHIELLTLLETLNISGCNFIYANFLDKQNKLISLDSDNINAIVTTTIDYFPYIQRYVVSNNSLTTIGDISYCNSLVHLDINHNQITDIGSFLYLLNLNYIDLSYNNISQTQMSIYIDEMWLMRYHLGTNSCAINVSNNNGLTSIAIRQIEGLSEFLGQGLKDFGCTVTY